MQARYTALPHGVASQSMSITDELDEQGKPPTNLDQDKSDVTCVLHVSMHFPQHVVNAAASLS